MAFTAVYFFQDSQLQANIEFEADRRNLSFAKLVSDLVCEFVKQKWSSELNMKSGVQFREPKNSRQFYFMCQEYAIREGLSIAVFIERACKRVLFATQKGEGWWKKVANALDLNRDIGDLAGEPS